MGSYVKSTYIEFWTKSHFNDLADKNYSKEKFEEMYAKHPSRMTPEQIKGIGRDLVRSELWSKWVDTKYNSLWNAELGVSTQIIHQLKDVISKKFPNLSIKVYEGEVKKYGEPKLRLTYMVVGDYDNNNYIRIVPTLTDQDYNYLTLEYCIEDCGCDMTRNMTDIQAMYEISKLDKYFATGEVPTFGVDKVQLWCENQYEVVSGKNKLRMHDTKMILFYHCIAKEMNKHFGTDYKYSQKVIDSLYKHHEFTNINYLGYFDLRYCSEQRGANVHEVYFYEDDKTKKPTFECAATYGDWSKQDLINILDVLYPYVNSNYFYDTSKESMDKKYGDYDKIGIRYKERPDYFDLLLWKE